MAKVQISDNVVSNAGVNVEQQELFFTAGEKANGQATLENCMAVSYRANRELRHHPAIVLLGIYPND